MKQAQLDIKNGLNSIHIHCPFLLPFVKCCLSPFIHFWAIQSENVSYHKDTTALSFG